MGNSKLTREPKNRRKKKKGRKPIEWSEKDYKVFENLCKIQATVEEIENVLELTYKTINKLCEAYYEDEDGNPMGFGKVQEIFAAHGSISIRRAQFKLKEKSAAMAIFMGKQYLGQKDNPGENTNQSGNITFNIMKSSEDPNINND